VLNFLLSVSDDPVFFNLVYIIMVDASRPIGGILFGLAFILVARKLQNQEIKDYLILTGIGFLLLLISYEGQVLITDTPGITIRIFFWTSLISDFYRTLFVCGIYLSRL